MAGALHGPFLCPSPIGCDGPSTWAWVLRAWREREEQSPREREEQSPHARRRHVDPNGACFYLTKQFSNKNLYCSAQLTGRAFF